jgi:hypothetical protein
MTIKSLRLTLVLALLMPHIYADSSSLWVVSSTQKDITVSAQIVTAPEALKIFGKKFWNEHIYPIRVLIENKGNKAVTFSSDLVTIYGTIVLTPNQLSAMLYASVLTGFLLVPMILLSIYTQNNFDAPMQHSCNDKNLVIEPNGSREIYLFANNNHRVKNSYFPPNVLHTAITLQSDGWIMKNNTTFNLPVALK